jgi:hypothetical protein
LVAGVTLTPGNRFWWGFLGGLCTYLTKVAILTLSGAVHVDDAFPAIGAAYVFGVLATALLGGVVSYALESHNVLISLYHGATAPAVFAFLSHVPK